MKNNLSIIFAILISLIIIFPAIPYVINKSCFLLSNDSNNVLISDENTHYAQKTTAFAKGYFGIGDGATYEHRKEYLNTSEKLPAILTGIFQVSFHNISITYIFTKILFISLTFITLNYFLKNIISHKNFRLFLVSILLLIPELNLIIPNFVKPYLLPIGNYFRRYYIALTVFPLFFILLKKYYDFFFLKKKSKKILLYIILIISLFAYSYLFFWIYSLALLTILTIFKIFSNKKILNNFFKIIISVFIFSSFFIFNLINNRKIFSNESGFASIFKEEIYQEARTHWYYGNTFSMRRILIFIILIFIIKLISQKIIKKNIFKDKKFQFLLLAILSSEACFNLNIITGISICFGHFYYVIGILFYLLIFIYIFYHFLKKYNILKIFKYLNIIILVLVLIFACKNYITNFQISKKCNQNDNKKIVNFLKKQKKEAVIYSLDKNLEIIILNYTKHFLFANIEPNFYTNIKFKETVKRLSTIFKMLNYDISFLKSKEIIDENNSPVFNTIISHYAYSFKYNKDNTPQKIFPSIQNLDWNKKEYTYAIPLIIKKDFLNTYNKINLSNIPYKLDYLIISKAEDSVNLEYFTLVFQAENYNIYKYNHSKI